MKMGDWIQADPDDILSMFTAKSRTPLHRKSFSVSGVQELKFSPSPRKALDFDGAFCSKENLDQCITYLNQELGNLGFPTMFHPETDTFDIVVMVNNLNEMLKLHRRTVRQKEALETRQQRSDSDVTHLQQSASNMKEAIIQLEKERNVAIEKERQIVNKNSLMINKLKVEKDEMKRLKSVMQHQDAQFKHELKKKERETNRLKERIHTLISDKNQERRFTMEISHPLQRSDGRRGKWRTNDNKHEEEMYSLIINSYEEKVQSFMVENHQLRECLKQLQHELKSALKSNPSTPNSKYHSTTREMSDVSSIPGDVERYDDAASVSSRGSDDLSEGHFQMPYDIVGEGIEKSLRQKCRLLKARIRSKETKAKVSPSESENSSPESQQHQRQLELEREKMELEQKREMADLEDKLSRYKDIIDQQETLIQSISQAQLPSMENMKNPFLNDSGLIEEKRSLEEQLKLFKEQKSNFEEERKKFTDAAIRLGLERKAFDEDRASYLTSEILQMTPYSNKTLKSKRNNDTDLSLSQVFLERGDGAPRLHPSTPCFSPAPKRGATVCTTPSTNELYRSMGIVSQREKENNCGRSDSEPILSLHQTRGALPSNTTPPEPIANSTRHHGNRTFQGNNISLLGTSHSVLETSQSLLGSSQSLPGSSQSLPGSRGSPVSVMRHSEHVENVKHALYQQRRSSGTESRGSSVMESRGSSLMESRGSSVLELRGSSVMESRGSSVMESRGSSVMESRGSSVLCSDRSK